MWVRFPPGVPKNDECNFAFVIFLRSLVNQPRSSMRRQPYSCRGAPARGKRQIPATVDNAKLRQFCIRHFVFHCDGGVTLTPRKTTLPETHPSDTPRPSMQWKANYLTTVFTIRLQLCIYCLIDSFKLVSVNHRITAEKQSPQ